MRFVKSMKRNPYFLILVFGIVSLLGDIVYEGTRGINGQYLSFLGATAAIVGFVSGLGELVGFSLRAVSGYISDKTKSYWILTILGYFAIISIPFLAFTNHWKLALILIVLERMGKAIRSPARDTLISYATKKIGSGTGFAIHEFLDQIGAVLGPFLIFLVLSKATTPTIEDYKNAYLFTFLPFTALMIFLILAYLNFKDLGKIKKRERKKKEKFEKIFWVYIVFTFFSTLGILSFPLIGYHLKFKKLFEESSIPLLYSLAMLTDALFAIFIGKVYDKLEKKSKRYGLLSLLSMPILTIAFTFLIFSSNISLLILGIIFFGFVIGAQETIMRAAISDITPISKRGTGYGIFSTFQGISSLLAGTILGFLYEISMTYVLSFVFITQLISLLILFLLYLKLE
ncbi:MAG: MFS transporter [Candidatus Aenigmatarchaeota archaeon]